MVFKKKHFFFGATVIVLGLFFLAVCAVRYYRSSLPSENQTSTGRLMLKQLESQYGAQIGIQLQSEFCRYYIPKEANLGLIIEEVYRSDLLDYFPKVELVTEGPVIILAPYDKLDSKEIRRSWRFGGPDKTEPKVAGREISTPSP